MDCSCRTAALRIFVKSIAQIHVPLRTAAPLRTQYQAHHLSTQPSRFYNQRKASVLAAASRTLHTSCARNSAAEAVQVAEEDARGANRHEDVGATEPTYRPSRGRSSTTKSHARTDRTSSGRRREKKAGQVESDKSDKKEKVKKERKGFNPKPVNEDHLYPPRQPREAREPRPPREQEPWMAQKGALQKKFPEGWNPRKKLSPDALVGIRMLHQQFPREYTTEVLAQKFEVSAEAIRRILKSKWAPDADKEIERQERWFNRGKSVWTHWAALGKKPPRRWRAEGVVRDPVWNKPRGPNHKDKAQRAEAQRRLAKGLLGWSPGESAGWGRD